MSKRTFLPVLLIGLAITFLLSSACGLITAPVSVPAAVASNAFFSLSGPIVDPSGQPLDGVVLSQRLDHKFWEPMMGETHTDEAKFKRFDKTYSVLERGESFYLTFSREGFADTHYALYAASSNRVHTDFGTWPRVDNFPVVLLPKGVNAPGLETWDSTIDYTTKPKRYAINLLDKSNQHRFRDNSENGNPSMPAGILYITFDMPAPAPVNAKGDINPADANLPGSITLHISGDNAGFIPIHPQIGYSPFHVTPHAPDTGYQPTLTFDRKRLREMRVGQKDDILEVHEYFFFTTAGYYGKGSIRFDQPLEKDAKTLEPFALTYNLILQSRKDNHDLTYYEPISDCTCKP